MASGADQSDELSVLDSDDGSIYLLMTDCTISILPVVAHLKSIEQLTIFIYFLSAITYLRLGSINTT